MRSFDKCPLCGGELVVKEVKTLPRGGAHTAVLKVRAEVCLRCGERLYSQEKVRRFEEIKAKLKRQNTAEFKPKGRSFEVVWSKRDASSTICSSFIAWGREIYS